jgi:1-acyl-sn-glycerol-3-phosphate acyltransferase
MTERQKFEFSNGYTYNVVHPAESAYKRNITTLFCLVSSKLIRPNIHLDPVLEEQLANYDGSLVIAASHHSYFDHFVMAELLFLNLQRALGGIIAKATLTQGVAGKLLGPADYMIPSPRKSRDDMTTLEEVEDADKIQAAAGATNLADLDTLFYVPGKNVEDPFSLGEKTYPGAFNNALATGSEVLPVGISGLVGDRVYPGSGIGLRGLVKPVTIYAGSLFDPTKGSKEDLDYRVQESLDMANLMNGRFKKPKHRSSESLANAA